MVTSKAKRTVELKSLPLHIASKTVMAEEGGTIWFISAVSLFIEKSVCVIFSELSPIQVKFIDLGEKKLVQNEPVIFNLNGASHASNAQMFV